MKEQTERFIELIKGMGKDQQGGLLLMLEGLQLITDKEKSGKSR